MVTVHISKVFEVSIVGAEFVLFIQARRTLFKTGTARVASKKTELGDGGVRGQNHLRKFLEILDALS